MSRNSVVLFAVLVGLTTWLVQIYQYLPMDESTWDHPLYRDGRWQLSGIVEEIIQKEMFGTKVDLLRVRYGRGNLWAAAGAMRSDGLYESFIAGAENREQVCDAFKYRRWVVLSV